MARNINRLTAVQVAKLSRPGYFPDGGNLYLQVSESLTKSWVFRYTLKGKQREMGLGSALTFTLAEARERATAQRKLLADGLDPLVVKRGDELKRRMAEANLITFDKAAEKFIETHEAGWKNAKHVTQWRNTLETYASPVIGALPVDQITTALVLRILQPLWNSKTETATRLRGRLERVLDWAKVQGYRSGENPAAWRGHLDKLLPNPNKVAKVKHHEALPWKDIGAFMVELRSSNGMASLAVEFIILTAVRTSEALLARWSEIDRAARVWTIPAERMKNGLEHSVPLSDAALAVLDKALAETGGDASGYVFPAPRRKGDQLVPLSNMAGLALLKRLGHSTLTVHGFRSTFRDWAAEETDYPNHVAEKCLAHVVANATEAAYRRGELMAKRRALMSDWAAFCATVRPPADVVPIRSKKPA